MTFPKLFLAVGLGVVIVAAQQKTAPKAPLTKAIVDGWMKELSNWGRWGKTDQMGTVNLITAAKRKSAAGLVRDGVSISLSRDADLVVSADNPKPFGRVMIATGSDPNPMFGMDTYTTTYHGQSLTHFDSLSHMFVDGHTYNGYPQTEISKDGAKQLAVTAFKNGFFSRGILMDIPRLKGVKYLDLSVPIYPEDLDAWEKRAGIKVGPGDIVFIRTGHWARRAEKGSWNTETGSAGLHASTAKWFHQRDIAVLGSDTHSELMPSVVPGVQFPMHQLLIIAMGTPMLDNCDLEALADAAAARGRWEFLLTVAPLAVPGGTGSPVNPIATF